MVLSIISRRKMLDNAINQEEITNVNELKKALENQLNPIIISAQYFMKEVEKEVEIDELYLTLVDMKIAQNPDISFTVSSNENVRLRFSLIRFFHLFPCISEDGSATFHMSFDHFKLAHSILRIGSFDQAYKSLALSEETLTEGLHQLVQRDNYTKLVIIHKILRPECITYLSKGCRNQPQLKSLTLWGCVLNHESLLEINNCLQENKNIHYLSFSHSRFMDDQDSELDDPQSTKTLEALVNLIKMNQQLKFLEFELSYAQSTEKDILSLINALHGHKSLQCLRIKCLRLLSDEAINLLVDLIEQGCPLQIVAGFGRVQRPNALGFFEPRKEKTADYPTLQKALVANRYKHAVQLISPEDFDENVDEALSLDFIR